MHVAMNFIASYICIYLDGFFSQNWMADPETIGMDTTPIKDDTPKKEERAGKTSKSKAPSGPLFTLKKWNAVAMWQWDVECDTCAICRVQVMGKYGVELFLEIVAM